MAMVVEDQLLTIFVWLDLCPTAKAIHSLRQGFPAPRKTQGVQEAVVLMAFSSSEDPQHFLDAGWNRKYSGFRIFHRVTRFVASNHKPVVLPIDLGPGQLTNLSGPSRRVPECEQELPKAGICTVTQKCLELGIGHYSLPAL
jgi:hypothetical protein